MSEDSYIYDLIIVGAGPAGISLAVEAIHSGIKKDRILILEKEKEHCHSIRKFYPENKLVTANYKGSDVACEGELCIADTSKEGTLTYFDEQIQKYQLDINYLEQVKSIDKKRNLFVISSAAEDYFAATCAIAIGVMGSPNRPHYAIPKTLGDHIHFEISTRPLKGRTVLVVGGGDSASEYAQHLTAENDVFFSYRRNELSRMNDQNRQKLLSLADEDRVELLLGSNVEKICDKDGRIEVSFDTLEPLVVDDIVYAIGGSRPKEFLSSLGISLTEYGNPIVSEHYETTVPGLFILGDLSAGGGGGSINSAFNSSKRAIKEFCKYYLECPLPLFDSVEKRT